MRERKAKWKFESRASLMRTEEICPARLSRGELEALQQTGFPVGRMFGSRSVPSQSRSMRWSSGINSFSIRIIVGDEQFVLAGLLGVPHEVLLSADRVHVDGSARLLGLCPAASSRRAGHAAGRRTTTEATIGVAIEAAAGLSSRCASHAAGW
jgi:hypothetical protein